MKYALGNMLNGAGSLNPDGLSLDLQFATDKTLTARKGPTPVFTRASTATFVGSDGLIQSAAINAARFDHDPVTLACKGLLIEESRTNLITWSEEMSTANGWSEDSNRILWVNNATTSPAGTTTAEKITELLLAGVSRKISVKSVPVVTGTTYTLSVYAKAAERSFLQITASANFTSAYQNFNLSNGTIGSGTATSSAIMSMGNGWYRCSIVAQASATANGTITVGIVPASTSALFATYLGADDHGIFLWGAQLEAGSFPTSYIPTTTGSVVRSADLCSITGADFTTVYNQSEVSIFSEFEFQVNNASSVVHCNNQTSNEVLALSQFAGPSRLAIFVVDGGVTQASTNVNANINQVYKAAISAKLNSFQFALGGVLGTRDTSGTMPTPTQINIGKTQAAVHLNGHIKQIKIFRKELSDAKLQALTA